MAGNSAPFSIDIDALLRGIFVHANLGSVAPIEHRGVSSTVRPD